MCLILIPEQTLNARVVFELISRKRSIRQAQIFKLLFVRIFSKNVYFFEGQKGNFRTNNYKMETHSIMKLRHIIRVYTPTPHHVFSKYILQ